MKFFEIDFVKQEKFYFKGLFNILEGCGGGATRVPLNIGEESKETDIKVRRQRFIMMTVVYLRNWPRGSIFVSSDTSNSSALSVRDTTHEH